MKRQTDPYDRAFSFIFIFLLAPEEGLFSTEVLGNLFEYK